MRCETCAAHAIDTSNLSGSALSRYLKTRASREPLKVFDVSAGIRFHRDDFGRYAALPPALHGMHATER